MDSFVQQRKFLCIRWYHVPYWIVLGDFVQALGSGMTVRYFQLFFVNEYGMSPVVLMCVNIIVCFLTALCAVVNQRLAKRLGRLPTSMLTRACGVACLWYMSLATSGPASGIWPVVVTYILRCALMNSLLGMTRSVIMDYIRKEHRAKWSAMESVSSFTWCGSAVIGGYLVDAHGYRFSFVITAVLHSVATLALLPAALVVRDPEEREEVVPDASAFPADTERGKGGSGEPTVTIIAPDGASPLGSSPGSERAARKRTAPEGSVIPGFSPSARGTQSQRSIDSDGNI